MIGNDLIDLASAKKESNWKRNGYLNKIYTPSEQLIITTAANSELLVWILWSMKEAAYKANHRITLLKEYAPIKINCQITKQENDIYYGIAIYNSLKYNTKTFVTNEYILTIAIHNSDDFSLIKQIFITDHPVKYEEYLKSNGYLNLNEKIVKNEFGIPNLYNEISNEFRPVSITHHGRFLSLIITS